MAKQTGDKEEDWTTSSVSPFREWIEWIYTSLLRIAAHGFIIVYRWGLCKHTMFKMFHPLSKRLEITMKRSNSPTLAYILPLESPQTLQDILLKLGALADSVVQQSKASNFLEADLQHSSSSWSSSLESGLSPLCAPLQTLGRTALPSTEEQLGQLLPAGMQQGRTNNRTSYDIIRLFLHRGIFDMVWLGVQPVCGE